MPPEPLPRVLGLTGRDFMLLMVATFGVFSNFAPLMSVVPLWSAEAGAGHEGVGAVTASMMATTVGIQLCMGRLLRRFQLRHLFGFGGLLMGGFTFGYLLSAELWWVLAISGVRGIGFGMVSVAGSALAAELVPAHQRGKAVGAYGVALGIPQIVCLPLGVWSVSHVGFMPVFLVSAVLALLAGPAMWLLSGQRVSDMEHAAEDVATITSFDRITPMLRPMALMLSLSCALGGIFTFVPLALEDSGLAPIAMLAMAVGIVSGRWISGVLSDRRGGGAMLLPAVLLGALGMGALSVALAFDHGGAAMAAALLYGLGFGSLQNDALVVMFRRAGRGGHGLASVVWNLAYDAGTGVGGIAVGALAASLAIPGAFAVVAVVIVVLAPLALVDARAARAGAHALQRQ